jgi:hypothetical protein
VRLPFHGIVAEQVVALAGKALHALQLPIMTGAFEAQRHGPMHRIGRQFQPAASGLSEEAILIWFEIQRQTSEWNINSGRLGSHKNRLQKGTQHSNEWPYLHDHEAFRRRIISNMSNRTMVKRRAVNAQSTSAEPGPLTREL